MKSENILTSHLLNNLQNGNITKIVRSARNRNVELRREVGNNSFIADILISLSPKNKKWHSFFDNKKDQFIAIEVKISDWKQGLYQAWRYNSFAEKSYLALYKAHANNVDLNLFKKYNVGLIVFDEKTIKIVHHPTSINFAEKSYESSLREKIWHRSLNIQSVQPAF